MVMASLLTGDDDRQQQQDQGQQYQPAQPDPMAQQPDPYAAMIGGANQYAATAPGPVLGPPAPTLAPASPLISGPSLQQDISQAVQQNPSGGGGGNLLERGLGTATNFLGGIPALPGVGQALQGYNAVAPSIGLPQAPNPTVGNLFNLQNEAMQQYGQRLQQVPGYTSLPAPIQAGIQAASYALLPGGPEGALARGATAFGSGLAGYGAQQGAAALGAGPVTQQAAALLGGIGTYEAAGRMFPNAPTPVPDPMAQPITGYHATDLASAADINQNGFRPGSFLSTDAEQARLHAIEKRGIENPTVLQFTASPDQLYQSRANPMVYQTQAMLRPNETGALPATTNTGAVPSRPEPNNLFAAAAQERAAARSQGQYPEGSQELHMYQQGQVDRALHPEWQGSPPTIGPDDGPLQVAYKEGVHGLPQGQIMSQVMQPSAPAEPRLGSPEQLAAMGHPVGGIPQTPKEPFEVRQSIPTVPGPVSPAEADLGAAPHPQTATALAEDFLARRGAPTITPDLTLEEIRANMAKPGNTADWLASQPANQFRAQRAIAAGSPAEMPPGAFPTSAGNAGLPPTAGSGHGGSGGPPEQPGRLNYGGETPVNRNYSALDYLNIFRALQAGGDFSMAFRQSFPEMFAHPQRWAQSMVAGARAAFSEQTTADFAARVAADPLRDTVLKNVYQSPTAKGAGTLVTREEQFASPATIPLLEKIPVVGGPASAYYRATERGTMTQLNQLRWDVSKDFATRLMESRGETPETITPGTQAQINKFVSAVNEGTGRGTLGSAAVEKAVLPAGQVFYSWRNAVAKPEYVAQIFSKPFTPAWNQIVRDQASMLIGGATTLAFLNFTAQQAGVPFNVGMDPRSADFGKGVIGNTHIDIWGGFQQPARAVWQAVMAEQGKPNAVTQSGREYQKNLGDIGLTFLGNKLSPQAALAGQIALANAGDRLTPGQMDALREVWPENRKPGMDVKTAAQFLTPLWIQDMATAIKNDGVGIGAVAGAGSFFGVGMQSYLPTPSAQVARAGTQALSEPETLAKAFPDSPIMQKALQGKDYNDLLPNEKAAIKAVLPSDVVQQLDEQNRQQSPATARHSDAIDALQTRKTQAEDRLLDLYNAGQLDKAHVVNAMKAVQRDYYSAKDKVDADPAYQAELAKFKSSGSDPSAAQKALDAYYLIGQEKGKAEQARYIQWLNSQDPQLASRIVGAIQPRNQPQLEKMYAAGELN